MYVKKIIGSVLLILICVLLFLLPVQHSKRTDQYRRLCKQLNEQLTDSRNANRRFAEQIDECRSICNRMRECNREVYKDGREIIETIEQLRVAVEDLEKCLNNNEYTIDYDYWDYYYRSE